MRPSLRRGIIWGAVVLLSLAAGFFGFLSLEISGWPEHHLYPPDFASNISDRNWNGWNGEARLDAALTQALRKSVGSRMQTASFIETLDRNGFLVREVQNGVCASSQSHLSLWLRGCKNQPVDLANLGHSRLGTMWYYWGGFPCNYSIRVSWQADNRGRVAAPSAVYGAVCV